MSIDVAVLCMIKNEAKTIKATIDSTKDYIDHIIIYDTGSTDNTIEVIKQACAKNGQTLHLKTTNQFQDFPTGRNESLAFAETIPARHLIMMDAGDELRIGSIKYPNHPKPTKVQFQKTLAQLPTYLLHGSVILQWLEGDTLTEHFDVRFIQNHKGARYDTECPVHETFADQTPQTTFPMEYFYLYQDREQFGESTQYRFKRDVELLAKAKPTKRNLYYLAQSYMAVDDLPKAFQCNVRAYQETGNFDDRMICTRIAYCALVLNMDRSIILKYLKLAMPMLEAYVNLLRYCLQNNIPDEALPYLDQMAKLEKIPGNAINHEQYDYLRWHLIARITVMYIQGSTHTTNKSPDEIRAILEKGKQASEKAIKHKDTFEDRSILRLIYNALR
jgi:glycosyltransferase involved in cell wall biosynthesis